MTTIAQRGASAENPLLVIERILRDREGVWRQIAAEERINSLIAQMLVSSTAALAVYGFVLGTSNSLFQALSSAIKLPILFLLTLVICLPTLYFFNLVFGSRLTVRQALAMVLAAITVTSMLTLAFAPISVFFLISAADYDFFKLLNVAILALTGFVGLSFLVDGMRQVNVVDAPLVPPPADAAKTSAVPAKAPVNMSLLYIWIVIYGFVGTQLGWTLRPFFGDPSLPFELFRNIKGNFYTNVFASLANLFG
jgi:hypothetical protein